jgi:hypothetical protein
MWAKGEKFKYAGLRVMVQLETTEGINRMDRIRRIKKKR